DRIKGMILDHHRVLQSVADYRTVLPLRFGAVFSDEGRVATALVKHRSVWLHERVLDALMRRHAVLPLRFATIVPDVDMLRNRLRHMYHELAGDLQRLRRKVEVALRIANIHAECPHTGDAERKSDAAQALSPGTRYLRARAERWRERIAS